MTKLAVVAPAATVTEVGVVSRALLSESVTVVAAVAALLKVMVQVLEESGPRTMEVQVSEESIAGALRLTVAVCDTPPSVALTVAD